MESDNLMVRWAILDALTDYAMDIENEQYRDSVIGFLDDIRRWSGSLTSRQMDWLIKIAEDSGELPIDIPLGGLTKRVHLYSIETLFS